MSSQHGGQSEMDISSVPQSVIWPKRYTPEELNGKTCFVMLHDGETLSDEYIGYSNLLGIVVKPLSKSEAVVYIYSMIKKMSCILFLIIHPTNLLSFLFPRIF